jgi:hypothetical protein
MEAVWTSISRPAAINRKETLIIATEFAEILLNTSATSKSIEDGQC